MIEGLVLLMLVLCGGWLVLALLGFMIKLTFWLIAGMFSLVGGALLFVVLLPVFALLALIALPLLILSMLPLVMPFLFVAAIVWFLLRERKPRPSMLR